MPFVFRSFTALLAVATALGASATTGCGGSSRPPPGTHRRIAVLAPAAAEMLDRLGEADRVVAVGDHVRRPARLATLPRLGAYDAPNVERLLDLHVDLVVTTVSRAAADAHRRMEALGIDVLALDTESWDGVLASLERLGRAVGRSARGAALAEDLRRQVEELARRAESLPRRRVLFVVGRDPLYVAGPGSHIDTMIGLAGGENVAADVGGPYRRLSLEAAIERMPEVIVDTSDNMPGALRGRSSEGWDRWPFLPAVRDDRVWHVEPDLLVIPGIRLPEMTRLLARLVHPETFGAPADEDLGAAPEDRRAREG